jgi:hypothetical protein
METGNLLNHGRACSSGINSNRQEPLKIEPGKLVNESYGNGIKIRRMMTLGREEQSDAGNYPRSIRSPARIFGGPETVGLKDKCMITGW